MGQLYVALTEGEEPVGTQTPIGVDADGFGSRMEKAEYKTVEVEADVEAVVLECTGLGVTGMRAI